MPSSAALIADRVPVKVIVASAVPLPAIKVSPAVPASVSVPFVAVSVTWSGFVPASGSLTPIGAAAGRETSGVSSAEICAPGTRFTGGSLATFATVTVTVAVEVSPLPSSRSCR